MDIKTLEEPQAADERTLAFTPLGLGGRMRPEDAADFQQRVIARLELAENVTEQTRQKFELLRAAYSHGVLCYELYTMVAFTTPDSPWSRRCATGSRPTMTKRPWRSASAAAEAAPGACTRSP